MSCFWFIYHPLPLPLLLCLGMCLFVCINKEIKLPAECDLRVHAINTYNMYVMYVHPHRYNRNGNGSNNNNNGQVGTVIKGYNRETCCCHSWLCRLSLPLALILWGRRRRGLAGKLWRKQKPKQNKNENQVKPRTVKRGGLDYDDDMPLRFVHSPPTPLILWVLSSPLTSFSSATHPGMLRLLDERFDKPLDTPLRSTGASRKATRTRRATTSLLHTLKSLKSPKRGKASFLGCHLCDGEWKREKAVPPLLHCINRSFSVCVFVCSLWPSSCSTFSWCFLCCCFYFSFFRESCVCEPACLCCSFVCVCVQMLVLECL